MPLMKNRPDHVTPERRTEQRAPLDLLMNRFLEGYPYLCRAVDISRRGIRLIPLHEPARSRRPRYMGLQLQLPGIDQVISASGEAVYDAEGAEVGVRFTSLSQGSASLIDRFVLGTGSAPHHGAPAIRAIEA